jgi:hypothetical protein
MEDNIKTDLKECEDVEWIHLDQDTIPEWPLVNTAMIRIPQKTGNFLNS